MMDYVRTALAVTIASFGISAGAQESYFMTAGCLIGWDYDDHPQICAEVAPDLKEQVAEARRLWLARNAKALADVKAACEVRLIRAYGGDQAAILVAKQDARRRRAEVTSQLLAAPNRHSLVSCSAYARDFATGNEKIDIDRRWIETIRDSPAEPIKWPNH
jgi:hypothetical protein